MRLFFLVTLLILPHFILAISEQPYHTTAYINSPGSLDLLGSYTFYSTDHFWDTHQKKRASFNDFKRDAALIYAEYALSSLNSLTFNGSFCFVKESLNGDSEGFTDFEIGFKQLLHKKNSCVTTFQFIAALPAGRKKSSIRYGVSALQLGLLHSKSFQLLNKRSWIDLQIGYRYYKEIAKDQLLASLALSFQPLSSWRLTALCFLEYGLGNQGRRRFLNNIVCNPNYRLINLQAEAATRVFSFLSFVLGGFVHVWGQNVGAGGGYYGGAWADF